MSNLQTYRQRYIGSRKFLEDLALVISSAKNTFSGESIDTEVISSLGTLAIVADGMGGESGGADASYFACTEFVNTFYQDKASMPPKALEVSLHASVQRLKAEEISGRTTLTAVSIQDDGLFYWVSTGDSRVYLFDDSEETPIIFQLTQDHDANSLFLTKVANSEMPLFEVIENSNEGAKLTSFIGADSKPKIDKNVKPLKLLNGQALVLVTDGLFRALSEIEIAQILKKSFNKNLDPSNELMDAVKAKNRRGQDNASAVVIYKSPVENTDTDKSLSTIENHGTKHEDSSDLPTTQDEHPVRSKDLKPNRRNRHVLLSSLVVLGLFSILFLNRSFFSPEQVSPIAITDINQDQNSAVVVIKGSQSEVSLDTSDNELQNVQTQISSEFEGLTVRFTKIKADYTKLTGSEYSLESYSQVLDAFEILETTFDEVQSQLSEVESLTEENPIIQIFDKDYENLRIKLQTLQNDVFGLELNKIESRILDNQSFFEKLSIDSKDSQDQTTLKKLGTEILHLKESITDITTVLHTEENQSAVELFIESSRRDLDAIELELNALENRNKLSAVQNTDLNQDNSEGLFLLVITCLRESEDLSDCINRRQRVESLGLLLERRTQDNDPSKIYFGIHTNNGDEMLHIQDKLEKAGFSSQVFE